MLYDRIEYITRDTIVYRYLSHLPKYTLDSYTKDRQRTYPMGSKRSRVE